VFADDTNRVLGISWKYFRGCSREQASDAPVCQFLFEIRLHLPQCEERKHRLSIHVGPKALLVQDWSVALKRRDDKVM